MFHGSPTPLTAITDSGLFGGVFAGSLAAARAHGEFVYEIISPRPLTAYELQYEIEGAWDAALEVARGDEALAEAILDPDCPCDSTDPEDGWEVQRLRGKLAARLGYTSVEMLDEHGTTWLCLPGCEVRAAA